MRHVNFAHHPDERASEHGADQSRRTALLVSHSFRLTDHGLHADILHEITWRMSSTADPQTAVVVSVVPPSVPVVLPFQLSVARTRLEVTRVQEIQPPAFEWLSPHRSVSGCE